MAPRTKSAKTTSKSGNDKAIETVAEWDIAPLMQHSMRFRLIGTTPLMMNRMTVKYRRDMLTVAPTKSKADRAKLRHRPREEYRDAFHIMPGESPPTMFALPAVAIKAAMADAAIETAGASKAGVQRLLTIPEEWVPVYGVPTLRLDVVRQAGVARAPDMRARPCFVNWAAEVEIRYIQPQLNVLSVGTLLQNAGAIIGVGDNRQQKGKGSFGLWRIVPETEEDEKWDWLVQTGGYEAQREAYESPTPYDNDTAELLEWWDSEAKIRVA